MPLAFTQEDFLVQGINLCHRCEFSTHGFITCVMGINEIHKSH